MKWKLTARLLGVLLIVLCLATSAAAECSTGTGDNLGKPRTDIEEGRSDTLTAPMVSWDQLSHYSGRYISICDTSTTTSNNGSASGCDTGNTTPNNSSTSACDPTPTSCPTQTAVCQPTPTKKPAATEAPCEPDESCDPTYTPTPTTTPTATPTAKPTQDPNGGTDGHYTPGSLSSQERSLLDAINQERVSRGLSALPADMEASALAREKSRDMLENGYFAHESPTYGRASDMLDDAGYEYTSVAENIARSGSIEKAHAALMSSDGHRRNILGSQWTRVGIGVVNDVNGYPYITQWFIR